MDAALWPTLGSMLLHLLRVSAALIVIPPLGQGRTSRLVLAGLFLWIGFTLACVRPTPVVPSGLGLVLAMLVAGWLKGRGSAGSLDVPAALAAGSLVSAVSLVTAGAVAAFAAVSAGLAAGRSTLPASDFAGAGVEDSQVGGSARLVSGAVIRVAIAAVATVAKAMAVERK